MYLAIHTSLQAKVVAPPMQPTNHLAYVGYIQYVLLSQDMKSELDL